jgi:hypothetical protein
MPPDALDEKRVHGLRWLLLTGWLGLLLMMVLPTGYVARPAICSDLSICSDSVANDIFWNIGLPAVLLCVVFSHALWRRLCPLSFVSQLAKALGIQRTITDQRGKKRLVFVDESSWLGRHHIQLQWSLLIAGLSMRILIANSNGIVLAVMSGAALLGALVTGWAYAGKSWCQYICPFGVAQQVITGPRSLPGRDAHLNPTSRTTQSMCRTKADVGQADSSACVACIKPCMDIDSERHYWANLQRKRGLNWAWYSYPGLVISFFLIIESYAPTDPSIRYLDYLKSHLYSYDNRLASMAWESMLPNGWPTVPRLIAIPLIISAAAVISQLLFQQLQHWQEKHIQHNDHAEAKATAIHRTRLLSTVIAVNSYFLFKGSPLPLTGPRGHAVFKLIVMAIMAMWLYRGWNRNQALYERESTSTSLRKQLTKLGDQLSEWLGGRRLDDLTPSEVFTLAKALPASAKSERRSIYSNVLKEQLEQGRLDRRTAFVKLEELRLSLGLSQDEHRAAIEVLEAENPRLQQLSAMDLAGLKLRRSAALEEIEHLLRISHCRTITPDLIPEAVSQELERIRIDSGLDNESWQETILEFSPDSIRSERELDQLYQAIKGHLSERWVLRQKTKNSPLLLPLLLSIDNHIARLMPPLVELQQRFLKAKSLEWPKEDQLNLLASIPDTVYTFLSSEDNTTLALSHWLKHRPQATLNFQNLPSPEGVLESVAKSSFDPSTRRWATAVRLGQTPDENEELTRLAKRPAGQKLLSLLEPRTLSRLPTLSSIQTWKQGEEITLSEDGVFILLRGGCALNNQTVLLASTTNDSPLRFLGLLDYLGGSGTSGGRDNIRACELGLVALTFHGSDFRELLDIAPVLEAELTRQLAWACSPKKTLQLH